MAVQVATSPSDRLGDFLRVFETAFAVSFDADDRAMFAAVVPAERRIVALDHSHVVGCAGVIPFKLQVPGGEVGAAGVTLVGVLPTHRRRGILTQMMGRLLDDAYRRGEPVAALWASEAAIYQRFGYGLGTLTAAIDVEQRHSAFARPCPIRGSIRLVAPEEAATAFPAMYAKVGSGRPGFFSRTADWWTMRVLHDDERQRSQSGQKFLALYEGEKGPEGYAVYRVKLDWNDSGPNALLSVVEAMATTVEASRELWRWLFDVDLVRRIQARRLPVDTPLRLQIQEPLALRFTVGDGLWVRLVDAAAALHGRRYGADGTLNLELRDERCPWNAGRWRLEVEGGRGRLRRAANGDVELSMDIADLGAMYLGAFTAAELSAAGRIVEVEPGAVDRATALFRIGSAPWCPEVF